MSTKTRWASQGDTISTVKPFSQYAGQMAGGYLHAVLETPAACAEGNDLIAAGRWQVTRCGKCKQTVDSCQCE